MELPTAGVLAFGAFALDLATGELQHPPAAPVVLGPRPSRLLALLAIRHGQLVTRNAIRRAVWSDGTTVDFDQAINQHVRQLRQSLGDDAAHPQWIQTLPGRGYRFLVPSSMSGEAPMGTAASILASGSGSGSGSSDAASMGGGASMAGAASIPGSGTGSMSGEASMGGGGSMAGAASIPGTGTGSGSGTGTGTGTGRGTMSGEASMAGDASMSGTARAAPRRRWVASLALVAAVGGVLLFATAGSGSVVPRAALATDRLATVRLAVLPLAVDDPREEGRAVETADALITALGEAYAPGLEVIALRSVQRYRDATVPVATIASELGVDFVVEGRLRTDGERVRIELRLIRARDAAQLWARVFEQAMGQGWSLEATIAQDVAAALGRVLVPNRSHVDAMLDTEGREAYLRGRYLLAHGKPREAAAAFGEITVRLPRAAKAWAALATAELRSGNRMREAAAAANAALAIDPTRAEAHYVRGLVALYGERDAERARRHFAAAVAANPDFAEAYHQLAGAYAVLGRHADAAAAMQRSVTLDPLAPEVVSDVGWYAYFAGDFATAATWCQHTLALEPGFYWAHRCVVLARARLGDTAGALAAALADLRARGAPPAALAAVTSGGLAAYWRWDLESAIAADRGDLADRAVSRLGAGDHDGALGDLEQAMAQHRGWLLPFLGVDPTFDALHGDPRFEAVLRVAAVSEDIAPD